MKQALLERRQDEEVFRLFGYIQGIIDGQRDRLPDGCAEILYKDADSRIFTMSYATSQLMSLDPKRTVVQAMVESVLPSTCRSLREQSLKR